MDCENNGSKPYEQMADLGGKLPYFWNTHVGEILEPRYVAQHTAPQVHWKTLIKWIIFGNTHL